MEAAGGRGESRAGRSQGGEEPVGRPPGLRAQPVGGAQRDLKEEAVRGADPKLLSPDTWHSLGQGRANHSVVDKRYGASMDTGWVKGKKEGGRVLCVTQSSLRLQKAKPGVGAGGEKERILTGLL